MYTGGRKYYLLAQKALCPSPAHSPTQNQRRDQKQQVIAALIHCSDKHEGFWADAVYAETSDTALLLLPLNIAPHREVKIKVIQLFVLACTAYTSYQTASRNETTALPLLVFHSQLFPVSGFLFNGAEAMFFWVFHGKSSEFKTSVSFFSLENWRIKH